MVSANWAQRRFRQRPEIFRRFVDILEAWVLESRPIQVVCAQITCLFSTAPDLIEGFKRFVPESIAAA